MSDTTLEGIILMEALTKNCWFLFSLGIQVFPFDSLLNNLPAAYLPVYAEDLRIRDFTVPLQVLRLLTLSVLGGGAGSGFIVPPGSQTEQATFCRGHSILKHNNTTGKVWAPPPWLKEIRDCIWSLTLRTYFMYLKFRQHPSQFGLWS